MITIRFPYDASQGEHKLYRNHSPDINSNSKRHLNRNPDPNTDVCIV